MNETPNSPTIPIIGGTGALGSGLARRWAASGAKVVIGSRDASRAAEAAAAIAAETGGDVVGMTNDTGTIVVLENGTRNATNC